MHPDVIQRLLDLNQEFYQTFAVHFSETRERVQPGVLRAIAGIPEDSSVLDLGCGNGRLSNALAKQGHHGHYLGLDSSQELLALAGVESTHVNPEFIQVDIARDNFREVTPVKFDRVFAFAVLHHIPGHESRKQLLVKICESMKSGGSFTFSVWNFLQSSKLRARVVPWSTVEVNQDQLEQGDFLLDWKRGGYGLRYVHAFQEEELVQLTQESGFEVAERYESDGEGGKLGFYMTCRSSA
jgi:trans-aconitate methyltransferase